jgi:hypothetical protein
MSGTIGILNPLQGWKAGDLPADPVVIVVLNEWGTTSDNRMTISASLATDTEIDFAIDRLTKDLELVRREAKRVLKSQTEKIRNSISKP